MDGDVSSFNSDIPDRKNKVVQAEAASLQPNVDESHEIVDESHEIVDESHGSTILQRLA